MDRTQETLNYMLEFTEVSTFRGFIPVASSYGLDYVEDNRNMTLMAIHDEGTVVDLRSDDERREQALLHEGKEYLVCILGVDNGSYMKRFTDQQAFGSWLSDVGVYEPDSDPEALFYNS